MIGDRFGRGYWLVRVGLALSMLVALAVMGPGGLYPGGAQETGGYVLYSVCRDGDSSCENRGVGLVDGTERTLGGIYARGRAEGIAPDGAYVADAWTSPGQLQIIDATGATVRTETAPGGYRFSRVFWSPGGRAAVVWALQTTPPNLYQPFLLDLERNRFAPLWDPSERFTPAHWAPDSGDFAVNRDGRLEIYGRDGNPPRHLANLTIGDALAWAPDSQSVLVRARPVGNPTPWLYQVPRGGGEPQRVMTGTLRLVEGPGAGGELQPRFLAWPRADARLVIGLTGRGEAEQTVLARLQGAQGEAVALGTLARQAAATTGDGPWTVGAAQLSADRSALVYGGGVGTRQPGLALVPEYWTLYLQDLAGGPPRALPARLGGTTPQFVVVRDAAAGLFGAAAPAPVAATPGAAATPTLGAAATATPGGPAREPANDTPPASPTVAPATTPTPAAPGPGEVPAITPAPTEAIEPASTPGVDPLPTPATTPTPSVAGTPAADGPAATPASAPTAGPAVVPTGEP